MNVDEKSVASAGKLDPASTAGGAADPLAGVDPAELKLVLWPDPRLKRKSDRVTVFGEPLRAIAGRMLDLMHQHRGVGLAAPQVGLNIRLFVVNPTGKPEDDRVYVNPVLSDPCGDNEVKEEGCLSLPDINVDITRPTGLKISAQDLSGQHFEQVETGFVTRVWQHENDHLDGRLIIDQMSPVTRMSSRKQLKKLEEDWAQEQAKKRKR